LVQEKTFEYIAYLIIHLICELQQTGYIKFDTGRKMSPADIVKKYGIIVTFFVMMG